MSMEANLTGFSSRYTVAESARTPTPSIAVSKPSGAGPPCRTLAAKVGMGTDRGVDIRRSDARTVGWLKAVEEEAWPTRRNANRQAGDRRAKRRAPLNADDVMPGCSPSLRRGSFLAVVYGFSGWGRNAERVSSRLSL
jgi:hypothetical protein